MNYLKTLQYKAMNTWKSLQYMHKISMIILQSHKMQQHLSIKRKLGTYMDYQIFEIQLWSCTMKLLERHFVLQLKISQTWKVISRTIIKQ